MVKIGNPPNYFVQVFPGRPDRELDTAAEARRCELQMATYASPPRSVLAGRTAQTGTAELPTAVFYLRAEEFAQYTRELTALSEIASGGNPELCRDELLDRSVIRFIDDRVLESSLLRPVHADTVGRRPRA